MLIFERKKSIENDQKSNHCHGTHQYWSVGNDFSVLEKLRSPAFQRHQARQNPRTIRSIRGYVLILNHHVFTPHIGLFFYLELTVPFDQDPHFNYLLEWIRCLMGVRLDGRLNGFRKIRNGIESKCAPALMLYWSVRVDFRVVEKNRFRLS